MKIDVHGHIYPDEYLNQMEKMSDIIQVVKLPGGRSIMKDKKGTTLGATVRVSIEDRIAIMDETGIDIQILSLANPNVYFADDKTNLFLAQTTNDHLSEVCKKYPNRFMCFASVPLNNVEDSIREIRRAINDLKMNGLALGTNINGKPLDSAEFWPFFEEVDKMGLPVLIHPMAPAGIEAVREYDLIPVLGFVFETTIAVTRMVCSGLLERCKNINLILSHLGGTLPYLIGRIDWGYRGFPECGKNIPVPPSEYLKSLYYDTALSTFHKPTLRCAYETVGAEHIVLGSDYPHGRATISIIEELNWPGEEKEKVYNGNIRKILKNLAE